MNILVINQPPFNRGDESAHKGLIRSLLKAIPNVKIRVLSPVIVNESVRQYAVASSQVEYINDPIEIAKFKKIRWYGLFHGMRFLWHFHPTFWKYKKIYQWADLVLCAPGGICMGGFQDWDHLFKLVLAKFFKRRLAYYGRSFGPFPENTEKSRRFKKISIEMLKYFSFLSIRDHKTEMLAEEMGIPYVSTVDSAFLDSSNVDLPYEVKMTLANKEYMVFVPNYLLWHYAYKDRISHETVIDFYCRVLDKIFAANPKMNVVMLPQIFGGKEYALNDVEFFRDLAKKKNDPRIIVLPDCYGSDVQQSIVKQAEYVIGSRYHSIVFAINQGIPCIALSYEHKISGLMESLELQKWCYDFSHTLDSEKNQQACLDKIAELIPLIEKNENVRSAAKIKAESCFNNFAKVIGEWHNG